MFEMQDRDELRSRLIEAARQDPQVDTAALIGSAARDAEDRWSDIDLALGLAPGVDPTGVADRWTGRLRQEEAVVDFIDIHASGGLYRVFLLASTLQVDLSFWPHGHLVTGGAPVRLLFGQTAEAPARVSGEDGMDHVRMAWLYALHVRSALARGRSWQAVLMLEGIRNRVIALYCLRHGLPTQEGRGVDELPGHLRSGLVETLVGSIDRAGLRRTFGVLVALLLGEAEGQALPVPAGLAQTLDDLVVSADRD